MILNPYVPKVASLHEAMYVYLSVERAVFEDLQMLVTSWAKENLGPHWHQEMLSDPQNHPLKGWKSAGDPYYIVKALAKIPHTPFFLALPLHPHLADLAWRIFHNRNAWAHYGNDERMNSIKDDIHQLVKFADAAKLPVGDAAGRAYVALKTLTVAAATLKVPVHVLPTNVETRSLAAAGVPASKERTPRPRIGASWGGLLPEMKLELNSKQRDILDPQTGNSARDRWPTPELAEQAVTRWFELKPSTPYVHVDPVDGAAVGFLDGHPYLIGYVGEEPEMPDGQFRGFQSKAIYVYDGTGLATKEHGTRADLSPEQVMRVKAEIDRRGLAHGEAFRITNYGDLVHQSEDGPVGILTL
jgi:hypothetical protein